MERNSKVPVGVIFAIIIVNLLVWLLGETVFANHYSFYLNFYGLMLILIVIYIAHVSEDTICKLTDEEIKSLQKKEKNWLFRKLETVIILMKLYLWPIVIISLIWGLMTLLFYDPSGFDFYTKEYLIGLYIHAVVILFFTTLSSTIKVKKKFGLKNLNAEILKVQHTQTIKTSLKKQAFLDRLENDPILGGMHLSIIDNSITLRSGRFLVSWGPIVNIRIEELTNDEYLYLIESRPASKGTMFDAGRSLENMIRVRRLVAIC